ncbi:MAG: SBBP repeat-containing protein [Deinococcales bacterium]
MRTVPRSILALAGLVAAAVISTGCSGDTTQPVTPPVIGNEAPSITTFSATSITGGAAYQWSLNDPDGDTLTCALDADGDGATDVNVAACETATSQTYAFPVPGAYTSRLTVSDGNGHGASAVVSVIAAGSATTPATWLRQFGGSSYEYASDVATDGAGNTTLVGYTLGALPGHTSAGALDIVLVKYDPDGSQLWARQFGGTSFDLASDVTIDGSGEITLVGRTQGVLPGQTSFGGDDLVLVKYDPDGSQLWARQFGGTGNDYASGITTDADGNTTVFGYTSGVLPGQTSAGGADLILVKNDPDGNQLWTRQLGTSLDDYSGGITTDAAGNTTVVGDTAGIFPGQTSAGGTDIVLVKYDPNGNQLWTRQFGSAGNDIAGDVTTDAAGNTILVGFTYGELPGQTGAGGTDIILAKYDPNGNQLWTRQFGSTSNDYAYGIATDPAGNSTLIGNTLGALPGHPSAGRADVILAKYDPEGSQLWTRQFGSASDDYGYGITADAAGNATLVGDTLGALPGQTSAGSGDVFITQYPP